MKIAKYKSEKADLKVSWDRMKMNSNAVTWFQHGRKKKNLSQRHPWWNFLEMHETLLTSLPLFQGAFAPHREGLLNFQLRGHENMLTQLHMQIRFPRRDGKKSGLWFISILTSQNKLLIYNHFPTPLLTYATYLQQHSFKKNSKHWFSLIWKHTFVKLVSFTDNLKAMFPYLCFNCFNYVWAKPVMFYSVPYVVMKRDELIPLLGRWFIDF